MKNILMLSIMLFCIVFPETTSAKIDGYLTITSPNGGESYTEKDITTITWDSSSNIDKVTLGYSTGPGSLSWIVNNIPNTGSYTWNVNVGNTTRTQFVLYIIGYETGFGSLQDYSDDWFTVEQKSDYPPMPEPQPEPTIIYGCTYSSATNYNPSATTDDGSCTYPKEPSAIYGCTYPNASNYNSSATKDDGSCTYPEADERIVIVEKTKTETIILGCTDTDAINYDSSATRDNGTCTYKKEEQVQSPSEDTSENIPTIAKGEEIQTTNTTDEQENDADIRLLANEILYEYYYFEGSKTTQLSEVNLEDVSNFTLDRKDLMYITFRGEANLTTYEAVQTIDDLDNQVQLGYSSFWMQWEFWAIFNTDVEAVFYNTDENLEKDTDILLNGDPLSKEEYTVETTKEGDKKVLIASDAIEHHVAKGEKIEVKLSSPAEYIPETEEDKNVEKNVQIPLFAGGILLTIVALAELWWLRHQRKKQ